MARIGSIVIEYRSKKLRDSGIAVGTPKVFDNRSLELMLQHQFDGSLNATQFLDKTQLSAAVGQFQGSQQSELSRDLELKAAPIPHVPAKAAPSTHQSQSDKKGVSGPDAEPKPPSAEAPAGSMPDSVTKKYDIAAEDILSEQVNLTYQIFNLRMLLQRSLSDRTYGGKPRLQTVLGFEVSLNPPKRHKGHAAVVEVRIPPVADRSVSLVAMMPREKTYNAAALATKVNQFGAAAVAKVVSVGYTERRGGQTFFLVKDSDTFAFQRNDSARPKGPLVQLKNPPPKAVVMS